MNTEHDWIQELSRAAFESEYTACEAVIRMAIEAAPCATITQRLAEHWQALQDEMVRRRRVAFVDISYVEEMGLVQKLSNQIRVF